MPNSSNPPSRRERAAAFAKADRVSRYELAEALGITVGELTYLVFEKVVSKPTELCPATWDGPAAAVILIAWCDPEYVSWVHEFYIDSRRQK